MIALQGLQRRLLLEDVERCELLHVPAVPPSTPPAGRPPQAPGTTCPLNSDRGPFYC